MNLPYSKRRVKFYSGYLIYYIVPINTIKGPNFKLSYKQKEQPDTDNRLLPAQYENHYFGRQPTSK
jgi:hypothetical protein